MVVALTVEPLLFARGVFLDLRRFVETKLKPVIKNKFGNCRLEPAIQDV